MCSREQGTVLPFFVPAAPENWNYGCRDGVQQTTNSIYVKQSKANLSSKILQFCQLSIIILKKDKDSMGLKLMRYLKRIADGQLSLKLDAFGGALIS